MLAGIGPPLASMAPVHCAHQSMIVGCLMLAADFHVVTPAHRERRGKVVANRVVVLPLVLPHGRADAVSAEADRHRAAAVDRRIGKTATHPGDMRVAV